MLRFLVIPAALFLMTSCQEKGPEIDFRPPPAVDTSSPYRAFDTSYQATIADTTQPRVVLIEEFTGVRCPNCPEAHDILKKILEANPGEVAVLGIQPNNNIQALPYNQDGIKTRNDNRTVAGSSIGSTIYGGIQQMPSAGIDRMASGGKLSGLFGRSDWPTLVTNRKAVPTKVNVGITNNYDAARRVVVIKVRVSYTQPVTMGQRLTVAITENNVIDVQELATAAKHEENYNHQHVFRDALTLAAGNDILGGSKSITSGQVYERTFVYAVPQGWNPDNCNVVAYITNNDPSSQEVMQAAEKPFK